MEPQKRIWLAKSISCRRNIIWCQECARSISNIADDQSAWTGDDLDVCRNADDKAPPTQDQPGLELWYSFGSAHPGVFQMAMCDASVHSISFDISPALHELLGNRRDGQPISDF